MMPSAKMMDPVMGVDVHIIQPPGPVPPVPVPHPFVGMLIDPMDLVPIVGATVLVNGMPRAIAGTAGKAIPPHIPIGGVFVKPPANECEMFMGSATVIADGDPASYMALPALSCQDIGMPAPPRSNPKKKTKMKSLVLPTSVVLPIPAGLPVLIGGPPTISMMALGMKAGMAALGKLMRTGAVRRLVRRGSRAVHARAARIMNRLGISESSRIRNRVHRAICSITGHPVDVATGKVFTESVDLLLPGPLPLRLERVWYSTSTYQGPLGNGWHHSYDLAVVRHEAGVFVRLPDGRHAEFDEPLPSAPSWNQMEGASLACIDDCYQLTTSDGLSYRFPLPPEDPGLMDGLPVVSLLDAVADRNGNAIRFEREAGVLVGIVDSAGRRLAVEVDQYGRIHRISFPMHGDAPATSLVTYSYDSIGNLVGVYNALGAPELYQYERYLLVRETDRAGASFHFTWDRDDEYARCTRTWGDDGAYARWLVYDDQLKLTRVTDSRGATTVYHWNELGLVDRLVSPGGGEWTTKWDDTGRKVEEQDPLGGTTAFSYDQHGRLTGIRDPDGAERSFIYTPDGRLIAAADPTGGVWQSEFDERGNVVAVIDPLGGTYAYTLDSRGLPVELRDPLGRVRSCEWDGQGNLVLLRYRNGREVRSSYDALGRVVERTDSDGSVTRLTWNALGLIAMVEGPSGSMCEFGYDTAGNLVAATDELRRVRQYVWGIRGALTAVIEPDGATTQYTYDTEGDLVAVTDALGRQWRFARDMDGRIVAEQDFTGRIIRYEHDVAGRVVAWRNGRGQTTTLERTASGRVISRRYHDGRRDNLAYDAAGRLIRAENTSARVELEYDGLGRVVRETLNDESVVSQYDQVGNRVRRESPFGRELRMTYTSEGQLSSVRYGRDTILALEYDLLGREIRRLLPGGAVSERQFSRKGALGTQSVRAEGRILFARHYEYDSAGQLVVVEDREFGRTEFMRRPDGSLSGARVGDQHASTFPVDRAGQVPGAPVPAPNTTRAAAGGPEGERRIDGMVLRFDPDGNLVEKSGAGQHLWFRYDTLGQLERVDGPDGPVASFAYDALGRRVAKHAGGRTVRFLWDGDVLVGERLWSDGEEGEVPGAGKKPARELDAREFLCDEVDFTPLLVFRDAWSGAVECDQVGTPRAVFDDSGLAWIADYEAFGQIRSQRGEGQLPFRFPGQYEDSETGLHYNRFRYFDPELRMYSSPDPVGLDAGLLQHNYVPDPTVWIDPFGLIIVYRNLRPDEDPDSGLVARKPGRGMTPAGHVRNGSNSTFKGSQYISTTTDQAVADRWRQPGQRTVAIDTDLLEPDAVGRMSVVDLSTPEAASAAGVRGPARNYANNSREVLLEGRVPPHAITSVCP